MDRAFGTHSEDLGLRRLAVEEQTNYALTLIVHPEPELRPLGPDDSPSILLDPSRTVADFGAVSFTPLRETVRAAVEYYRTFGMQGGYTHLKLEQKN